MKNVLKYFLGVIGLWVTMSGCQQERLAKRLPLEVFFQNPVKTAFKISPSGTHISYLKPYKNRLNIFVQNLDGTTVRQVTAESERNISNYFWINEHELLYIKDWIPGESEQLYVVNRDGSNNRAILPEQRGKVGLINANRIVNNELLVALLNKKDSTVFDAYRLNITNKKLTLVEANPGNIMRWYADGNGKLRLALASDGVNETLLYRNDESERFKPVVTNNFKTTITPIGFCPHNKACVYALSNQNRDKKALIELNCITGKEDKELFKHPEVDISEASYSYKKQKLQYAVYETQKKKKHFLDSGLKTIYTDLEKFLPEMELLIVDKDSLEKKLIVKSFTDKTPGAFYLYLPETKKLTKLSAINPSLPASEMCEMTPVSFKNRDGLTLNAYLTLPKGVQAVNLPVVVIPHGGPSTRNSWGFDPEVQFLANRGYAVFQINFRGSTGYGKKFWIAGFKQWGGIIQNDITDGVNYLIKKKIADKNQIAIYGSGFGGFSALYGLCFQPNLYACGVSYSGLFNLFTFMKGIPPYYKPFIQMHYERVGNPEKDTDYFRAVSPIFHANKIKNPVLIALGAKDPRANLNEVNQFVKELKNRRVPISYLLKENEGIYFKKEENRLDFYRKLELFFAENLKKQ